MDTYKKKYEEVLERAKSFPEYKNVLSSIFPELEEVDGEKIRKALLHTLQNRDKYCISDTFGEVNVKDAISWLERQGTKDKYTFNSIPRLLEMIKPTDKAKVYCQKLIDSLLQEGYATDAKIVGDCLKQMNNEEVAMATMDEQSVPPDTSICEHTPPKLEESEDAKIKKEIEIILANTDLSRFALDHSFVDMIDWLEKQGKTIDEYEDKLYRCACESFDKGYEVALEKQGEREPLCDKCRKEQPSHSCQDIAALRRCAVEYEKKSADKVEPKFKVGDVVIWDGEEYTIQKVRENTYRVGGYDVPIYTQDEFTLKSPTKFKVGDWIVSDIYRTALLHILNNDDKNYEVETPQGNTEVPSIDYVDRSFHLWTVQDAKDGDVLCYEDEVFILKNYVLFHKIVYHCCYDGKNFIPHSIYSLTKDDFNKIHPATKEQRDLLFQKMKKLGYEWDSEKRELEKL